MVLFSTLRRIAPPLTLAILTAMFLPGCQGGGRGGFRRSAAKEPALISSEGGEVIVEPAPRAVSWADRHPIVSRPREYYEEAGGSAGGMSKVKATGRATFIGIPSGIAAEVKQIVTGVPAPTKSTALAPAPSFVE